MAKPKKSKSGPEGADKRIDGGPHVEGSEDAQGIATRRRAECAWMLWDDEDVEAEMEAWKKL
jgi:hypothetical protein